MLERIHFLVMYVGSAAVTAFMAACLSSPQVSMFNCETSDGRSTETCELVATLSAAAVVEGELSLGDSSAYGSDQKPVAVAAAR